MPGLKISAPYFFLVQSQIAVRALKRMPQVPSRSQSPRPQSRPQGVVWNDNTRVVTLNYNLISFIIHKANNRVLSAR